MPHTGPVPIFDSLSHPTLTGRWIDGERDAGFESLARDLARWGFSGACAVGLAGVGGYAHEAFLEACAPHPALVPIAGLDPSDPDALGGELERIAALGFRGVKVHPRLARWTPTADALGALLRAAAANGLPVLYCTYRHAPLASYPGEDPFYVLVRALQKAPEARVILMHGGDVSLMRHAELVRFNDNLLLDLSFTMLKYRGSSIDADIAFLLRGFDRRICVGTDHPELRHQDLRERFDKLTTGIEREKVENAAFRNIETFLGVARHARR
jgi:predicted TIM-barrel fold metal-dependent hydrolase